MLTHKSLKDAHIPLLAEDTSDDFSISQWNAKNKFRKGKFLLLAICGIIMFGIVICIYTIRLSPEFNQYNLLREYEQYAELEENAVSGVPRTILLWNSFFGNKRWGQPEDTLGPAHFRDEFKCPVWRCELTNVRDLLPSVDMFDAVLFHTAEPFPIFNSVPARRKPQQFYVFASMESPAETKHILGDEGGFYNLTMTYRLDSDLLWAYDFIMDSGSGEVVAPAKFPIWRQPPTEWKDTDVWNLWEGKNNTAAWFVSHCETISRREKLVQELQKYIDVDVYGTCGTLSCPHNSKECNSMLDEKYKFYFSFENALCEDYVTEKLYNALQRHVIPVVYGAANYTHFVPPHSYINVDDYETVEDLAKHLQYLATHPLEYMRYFWWRKFYHIAWRSPYCDLCEKMHSITYRQKMQTYQNIEKWWVAGKCRFEAKIKF